MEQHPVPQQISSYEFRLVGDMTLKQFFQLAGGALTALLIYSTEINPFIKWPLIVFFSLFGAALAFLPFEGRPLEKWIVAFFKSIYSPTLYFWKKPDKPYVFFAQAPTPQEVATAGQLKVPQPSPALPGSEPVIALEQEEQSFLKKLTNLFSTPPAAQPARPPQTKVPLQIPEEMPTPITQLPPRPKPALEQKQQKPAPKVSPPPTTAVAPTVMPRATALDHAAQFSREAAPPNPPTQPNIIVGQVMDPEGKIAEATIIEIRDDVGRPVRAFRTNRVGHFLIATPLASGKYKLIAEKEGFVFDPINIEAKGQIIPPIAIRAKARMNNEKGEPEISNQPSAISHQQII